MEKIIQLKRQEAACLSEVADSGVTRRPALYDALLDDYEPGARSAELAILFQALREELVPLVQTISEASARRTRDGKIPKRAGAQETRSSDAAIRSIDRGSLARRSPQRSDSTFSGAGWTSRPTHSAPGSGPGDTRITTRYDERQFGDAFFGVLHEVGHGLYEQGLPAEHFGTPHGRVGLPGSARVAVAALGKRGGAKPAFLDVLVPDGPAGLSPGPP